MTTRKINGCYPPPILTVGQNWAEPAVTTSQISLSLTYLPAKVEFAKLSLKVLSSQPSWLTVNWVTFRAVTLPCLYPLLLVKSFLFSVLETMQGLFVCLFGVVFPI